MLEHSLDLPLGALVAVLVVKEAFGLVRTLVMKRNGGNGRSIESPATALHVATAKADILLELRNVSDAMHGRITEVGERVSRLEGAQVARGHIPFGGTGS